MASSSFACLDACGNPRVVSALLLLASFTTWRIFKHFEPDKPLPVTILLVPFPALLSIACYLKTKLPVLVVTPAIFGAFYALILSWTVAYRLSPWHPLARFPGPVACKVSKSVMAWRTYGTGDQHRYIKTLHEAYGDIVRIGPNELSTNRADCVPEVLGPNGLPKGVCWYNRVPPGSPSSLVSIRDPAVHRVRRKVWDRALSAPNIREHWGKMVLGRVEQLVGHLERVAVGSESGAKAGEGVVDVSGWMSNFAFDIMGDMSFGGGFEMMKSGGDTTGMTEALQGYNKQNAALAHIPWAHTYSRLLPFTSRNRDSFAATARAPLMRRMKEGAKSKDLFWFLGDEESPTPPSRATIAADGIMAVVAGSDTTATTLTALWYFLLRHPEARTRLEAEVDNACFPDPRGGDCGDWGEEEVARMAEMAWLNACINETLRLVPAIASGSQRSVPPGSGGTAVGPYFIPEGTQITVHTYSLHRNPAHFSSPNAFLPERWLPSPYPCAVAPSPSANSNLDDNGSSSTRDSSFIHDQDAFYPFSTGPTNCAGRAFALFEVRAVVCALVRCFRFRATQDSREREGEGELAEWEGSLEDYFVLKRGRLNVKVERRR
ncbi:high nitrogen upregulated cytochrome P450 monooxygenase 2 [Athelia psychrophila]|uniref:High nitrogen upregulated cytochrome P450 monooxygenase 2 n=1 Tax=Athelia psychrophila TaxID=1759441 RepID=A0A166SFP4_9AGAM|nr:high nitrogen upregulated cytochrome P450 monooxygenase 2 [Fibularhizoctonia sp. CBS 109695]